MRIKKYNTIETKWKREFRIEVYTLGLPFHDSCCELWHASENLIVGLHIQ